MLQIGDYRILDGKNNVIISNNSHTFFRSENHIDIFSPKKLAHSGTRAERKKGKAW